MNALPAQEKYMFDPMEAVDAIMEIVLAPNTNEKEIREKLKMQVLTLFFHGAQCHQLEMERKIKDFVHITAMDLLVRGK